MADDPRIAAAMRHWAGRFVANGVPYGDLEALGAALTSWDGWCAAWSARAAAHEALGEAALAEGRRLSAGEHFTDAAVCYHFGKFLFVHDPAQMRAAHGKAVECRCRALPYLRPAGERVAIPYAGGALYGILRKPDGVARPPVVVMIMGLDSTKEEMTTNEAPFLARFMATLAFDGPGQGEAEYDQPIRADYEAPVKAVIDFLETRADVDATRIGLWGVSLGGYYAPRAAAFETRVRACVALSGPFDWGACWDGLPALTREAFRVRAKCRDEAEARRFAAGLTLADAAPRITCPLFLVAGKKDGVVPWTEAERLAKAAKGETELLVVEDGGHVVNNRPWRYRTQAADWMARRLGAESLHNSPRGLVGVGDG